MFFPVLQYPIYFSHFVNTQTFSEEDCNSNLPLPRYFIKQEILLWNDLRVHGSFPVQQMFTILSGHSSTQVAFKKRVVSTGNKETKFFWFQFIGLHTGEDCKCVILLHTSTLLCGLVVAVMTSLCSVNGRFGTDDKVRILWRRMRGAVMLHVSTALVSWFWHFICGNLCKREQVIVSRFYWPHLQPKIKEK